MVKLQNNIVVGVCGSADEKLESKALEVSRTIGRLLAEQGVAVITGGMRGVGYEAAEGAKLVGGLSICFSHAEGREEHVSRFKKPLDAWKYVIYTGLGLKGRNVLLVQSSDAVIFIGGGTGTLNEFTIAYDHRKPIGLLTGISGTMELVDDIIEKNYKSPPSIVRSSDPEELVELILEEAKQYIQRTS